MSWGLSGLDTAGSLGHLRTATALGPGLAAGEAR